MRKRQVALSLVEVLVAFAIFTLLLFLFLDSLAVKQKSQSEATYRNQAEVYAQEALAQAQQLTVGQQAQADHEGSEFHYHVQWSSQTVAGYDAAACRELHASVQVTRQGRSTPSLQLQRTVRSSDVNL